MKSRALQSIRAYCLDCCRNQQNEVRLCPSKKCSLYPFRMGTNPYRKTMTLTEEHKAKLNAGYRNHKMG